MDPDEVGAGHVGLEFFGLGFGAAQIRAGQEAVPGLHRKSAEGGIEDLSGHVRAVAAGVGDPHGDILYLPAVGVGGQSKGIGEGRFIGGFRQKGLGRCVRAGFKDQKLACAGGGRRVPDLQGGEEHPAVFRAPDGKGVFARRVHHLVCDGVQQLPVKALCQEEIRAGDGAARLHNHPLHRGAHGGGSHHLALVAAAVLQEDMNRLFPGCGEVICPQEADGHPVRILKVGDEFVRPGHVARGELQRHRLRGGSSGVLHDQQAGHHPDPGDDLHHMPSDGLGVLVGADKSVLCVAKGAGGGHTLAVFPVDHRGESVVYPQHQCPQGQQKPQKNQ